VNHGKKQNRNRLGAYHASQMVLLDFVPLKTRRPPIRFLGKRYGRIRIKIRPCQQSGISSCRESTEKTPAAHPFLAISTELRNCETLPPGHLRRYRHHVDPEVPNLHELDLDRVIVSGTPGAPGAGADPGNPVLSMVRVINIDSLAFSTTLAEQRGYLSISERDRSSIFDEPSRLRSTVPASPRSCCTPHRKRSSQHGTAC